MLRSTNFGWLVLVLVVLWSHVDFIVVAQQEGATETSLPTVAAAASADVLSAVTVLGLGQMGAAVVRCLSAADSDNVVVHAWNRGVSKRAAVASVAVVHDTAQAAVAASNMTLILIDDWNHGTVQLLRTLEFTSEQTIVVFSTYTPTDIRTVQQELFPTSTSSERATLVGGAIVGVPQTICSPRTLILTSSGGGGTDSVVASVLKDVGRTVLLGSSDVGLAALANMALILVITFGVAGHELALLMVRQYMLSLGDNQEQHLHTFLDVYAPLAAEIGPAYANMLLPVVSQAMRTRQYDRSYVPVGVFRNVLRMHAAFLQQLGVANDTFLAAYLQYLERVPHLASGPAAWTELAVVEKDATDRNTATTASSKSTIQQADSVDDGGSGNEEL